MTFSVKARAVVRCLILLCAPGPCGLELDGTGGPLAKRLQVEDQPLDSLMAYDIKCFLHLFVLISQESLYYASSAFRF